jgi:YVTN family beta-propeller protein
MVAVLAFVAFLHLAKPSGIAVVVNQQSDSVSLVDIAQYKVLAEIPVGGGPHESAVSPDGKRAIVSNYFKQGVGPGSSLSVIDIAAKKETKKISLDKQAMPHDVRWVNDNQVVCTDERNERLLLIDVAEGKVLRTYDTAQRGSHMLSLHLGESRLVCSNMGGGSVTIFDFKTAERITTISTGRECEGVGIAPDGKTIWAGNRAEDTISIVDMDTKKVVKKINSLGFPYRVQFTPNGRYALIPHAQSGELVVCDVASREIVRRIKIGASGTKLPIAEPSPAGVWPLADNMFALVTVRNDNSVTMVDLTSGETMMRVVVGQSPDGVSMKPGNR